MPEQLSREQRLEIALRDMIRHYRNALESARSRIIEAHDGDESACDTVEQMTRHDPYIRNAEKALALGVLASAQADDGGPLREGWQISIGPGHAGFGCYAHLTEYPDEGAICLATFDPKEYPDAASGVKGLGDGRQ